MLFSISFCEYRRCLVPSRRCAVLIVRFGVQVPEMLSMESDKRVVLDISLLRQSAVKVR